MREYELRHGMTLMWTDGEKFIVSNPSGPQYVPTHVDTVCGLGEWEKVIKAAYLVEDERGGKGKNPNARNFQVVSGYVPKAMADKITMPFNGLSDEDAKETETSKLIGKYFEKG